MPRVLALLLLPTLFCPAASRAAGRQLTGVYAPTPTPALAPADAQKKFAVPEGFEVRLFAAEPDVVNPVAMTWDDRGRLWVVELYEYPLGAPAGIKPRDKIKILEDTDGDGRADKVTVFADGLNLATGILLGYGGAFVGQAPHLLFLEDTNGDDVADKRTILKTGFGLEDRHELLNGFTWGPDGWLYMTHGVFTRSRVKDPDKPNEDGVLMTAAVARYHPRTKKFEVFAEGTSNPWGVDFDAAGNAFVTACVIDHLFHMAPGGSYVRQAGNPPNPYQYELIPSIVDHKHFRAAYAGVQIYQGDQYPEDYQGTIMMGNIHDSAIHQDRLTPNGSSFKATFMKDFVRANDGWFRPVSIQTGPDGALWIMDWYDKYPCYQNANADPEGVDREHGRIWRVVYTGTNPGAPVRSHPESLNLAVLRTDELVAMLAHKNVWQRRAAQRLLSERRDPNGKPALIRVLKEAASLEARLAALWTLHSSDQLDDTVLDALAAHADAPLRMWVARLTGERGQADDAALSRLRKLASDPDNSVRVGVATALRQFTSGSLTIDTPSSEASANLGPILSRLTLQPNSASDPLLPFMIWTAIEPRILIETELVLRWFVENGARNSDLASILIRKTMRRICDSGESAKLDLAITFLEALRTQPVELMMAALDGLITGQKGKAVTPSQSGPVLNQLLSSTDSGISSRARQLGTIWGESAAVKATLAAIENPQTPVDQRVQAIQSIKAQKLEPVKVAMLKLVAAPEPEKIVQEALRALAEIGTDEIGDEILKNWKRYSPASQRAAAEVLASRRNWARLFLTAVGKKSIAPGEIPAPVARSLAQSQDDYIRNQAAKVIGRVRDADKDKLKLIAARKLMVLNGPADLNAGHAIAQKTCFTCHKLYGEGADVGPDLTGVGRSTLDALLANVIDPNQIIGSGYENVEIETKDGRTVSGRLVEETDTRIKLLSAGPKEEVVAKTDIATKRVSEMSVMPEGLEQMPDVDFRNLIWYILNPPQEERSVSLERKAGVLSVRARAPGSNGKVELAEYVLDPAVRPYLHPVKDPSGKIVLTQDRPADHVWQHGIFTGLHKVNGLDFWTENEGKQKSPRLVDLIQEPDRAGWRSLTDWVSPAGEVILEEEQTIQFHALDKSLSYVIDFDWGLRAPNGAVKIGRHDYGGLAVRMPFDPRHTHLNSNGEQNKATANKKAAWCDVSRPFGNQMYGMAVFDHPSNSGHPATWRVDDQGLINPSPSLQGDWTIEAGRTRRFHYRILVHEGERDARFFDNAFQEFSRISFGAVAQASTVAEDGESVALWNPEWKVKAPKFEGTPAKLPEYAGRRNVLSTHPVSRDEGATIERTISVPATGPTQLTFNVAAHERGDWELRVSVDGKVIQKHIVGHDGDRWRKVTVDLGPYRGKTVPVRLENCANGWEWEFGYWSDIQISNVQRQASR